MATQERKTEYSEASRIKQTREEQFVHIRNIIAELEPQLRKATGYQKDQLRLLKSVSIGLYDEIDKLSKKAPAEPVTDLVLAQMNEVIREAKELIEADPYVQRLQEFTPSGNNPQHRDAVVIMRQLRQGLERFHQPLDLQAKQLRVHLTNATCIELALQLYLAGNPSVTEEDLKAYDVKIPKTWLTGIPAKFFDFGKLDKINIATHFQVPGR